MEHQQERGDRYPGHKPSHHPDNVQDAYLPYNTVGVKQQQPEPVRSQHDRDAEETQQGIEDLARKERTPDVGVRLILSGI
ncbi:MAG TPA: hypothetical protein VFE21_07810 [Rubrobacteraceae bacterium]|nr:hypothetical protein [Rubrobacteraceae bacterium]